MGSKLRSLLILLSAVLASLAFAAPALAKANKLKVKGPGSVKLGSNYKVTVSGNAKGNANFVVGWEYHGAACKSNYGAEYAYLGSNAPHAAISTPVSGHFKLTAGFTAGHVGKARFCAYLINRTTTHTYKHAGATWREHR